MRYSDNDVQAPKFASIWIAKMLCCYPTWGFGMWAVVEKETSEVIGYAGLSRYSGRCEPNEAELGFRWRVSIGVEVTRPRPPALSAITDCVDCCCRESLPSSIPEIWPRYE
jgi:hypothetical protein